MAENHEIEMWIDFVPKNFADGALDRDDLVINGAGSDLRYVNLDWRGFACARTDSLDGSSAGDSSSAFECLRKAADADCVANGALAVDSHFG